MKQQGRDKMKFECRVCNNGPCTVGAHDNGSGIIPDHCPRGWLTRPGVYASKWREVKEEPPKPEPIPYTEIPVLNCGGYRVEWHDGDDVPRPASVTWTGAPPDGSTMFVHAECPWCA